MDTLKERLTSRLAEMNINFSDLARELDLDRQHIYGWTRRGKVPNNYLFPAAKFLNCDPQWLQHGQYSRPSTLNVSPSQVVIPIFKQGEYKDMQDGDRLKFETLICRDDWLAELFGVNPSQGDYEIYRMESNEMQPAIMRGDLVVIDRAAKTHVNGLYGIETKGGALSIARVQWDIDGESVTVSYDNQNFTANRVKASKLELVGRVIYVWQGKRDF